MITLFFALYTAPWEEGQYKPTTIEGSYLGVASGMYQYADNDGFVYEFRDIEGDALKKLEFLNERFVGTAFYVTYRTVIEIDDSDEDDITKSEINSIVDLEMVVS